MKQVRSRSKWPAGRGGVPLEVRREMVVMVRAGASWQSTAERFGVTVRTVARVMRDSGGMPPRWSARSPLRLSLDERVLIMVGLEQARSFTAIAAELGRSTSTVSRDVNANGGRAGYRAVAVDVRGHGRSEKKEPYVWETFGRDLEELVTALGYDMNTVEWAVRDGVAYAIDFMNPAPDMDVNSLTPAYFDWCVTKMADLVIDRAVNPRPQLAEMRWSGLF